MSGQVYLLKALTWLKSHTSINSGKDVTIILQYISFKSYSMYPVSQARVAGKLSQGHGSDNALGSMSSTQINVLCTSAYCMMPIQDEVDSRC